MKLRPCLNFILSGIKHTGINDKPLKGAKRNYTQIGIIPEICNSNLQKLGREAFQLATFSSSAFFEMYSEISESKMAMSPS